MTGTESPATGSPRRGFGIDVGGSGVKGGIVDLDSGQLIGDRFKLATPSPPRPTRSRKRSPRWSPTSAGTDRSG